MAEKMEQETLLLISCWLSGRRSRNTPSLKPQMVGLVAWGGGSRVGRNRETSGGPRGRLGTSTYPATYDSAPSFSLSLMISGMGRLASLSKPIVSWIELYLRAGQPWEGAPIRASYRTSEFIFYLDLNLVYFLLSP